MKTKKCNECGEIKEVSPEFFYRKKRKYSKDGLSSICKSCAKIKTAKSYAKNRDVNIKRSFEYYHANKEICRKKAKERYLNNKDRYIEKSLEYYYANREAVRAKQKEYREGNKPKIDRHMKDYYSKNARSIISKNNLYDKSKRLVVKAGKEFSLIENIVFEKIVKIKTKFCKKCKQSKPANLDYWHKDSDYKDGFKTKCKVCCNNVTKEYYRKSKIKNNKYNKYNGAKIEIDRAEVGGLIKIMMDMVTTKR